MAYGAVESVETVTESDGVSTRVDTSFIARIEGMSLLLLFALCVAGLLIAWIPILQASFPALWSDPQDFTGLYISAQNAGTNHLYDLEFATVQQHALAPSAFPHTFMYIRLPFYALLCKPITLLSYPAAIVFWKCLSVAALLVAAFWADRSWKVGLLAMCWSFAAATMLKWGEDTWVILLLVTGYFRILTERPLIAGVLLGLALAIKPYAFLPLAVALVFSRERRGLLRGVAISASGAVVLSVAIQGTLWPSEWLQIIRRDGGVANVGCMLTVGAIFLQRLPEAAAFYAGLFAAACLLSIWIAKQSNTRTACAVAILLGLITSPHSYPYDILIALPGLLWIARQTGGWAPLLLLSPLGQLSIPRFGPLVMVSISTRAVWQSARVTASSDAVPVIDKLTADVRIANIGHNSDLVRTC
jgi:hypothetical protein